MARAIYAGSFDPVTNGHMDVIRRAANVFDQVIVLVARNPNKNGWFSVEERKDLVREACPDPRVIVDEFQGLLVDYARQKDINVLVRGLRAVSDFEFEGQMANMNRHLHPEIETFFMMTSATNFYVSSSLVREVAKLGGDISALVPPVVARAMTTKLSKKQ
jgi:pantetheine-phosphate adenylyltransferase